MRGPCILNLVMRNENVRIKSAWANCVFLGTSFFTVLRNCSCTLAWEVTTQSHLHAMYSVPLPSQYVVQGGYAYTLKDVFCSPLENMVSFSQESMNVDVGSNQSFS